MTLAPMSPVATQPAFPRTTPVREYVAGGKIKGGLLRAHLRWAREHADAETFRAILDALPPKRVEELSTTIFATSWYPLQWLVDFDRAVLATIGNAGHSVLHSAGRFSANATLRQIHSSLLRDDPHSFLRHVALLQSHFTDFGSSTWERLGTSFGRVTHRYWRCFSPLLCESAIGFYEEAARMAGGTGVTVEETSCQCRGDKHCAFLVRWRG
ncbi:MAG: hypothetical protein WC538_13335 [Thermoanaerobaculia bacterium]|jgi:hypothetical protein